MYIFQLLNFKIRNLQIPYFLEFIFILITTKLSQNIGVNLCFAWFDFIFVGEGTWLGQDCL